MWKSLEYIKKIVIKLLIMMRKEQRGKRGEKETKSTSNEEIIKKKQY